MSWVARVTALIDMMVSAALLGNGGSACSFFILIFPFGLNMTTVEYRLRKARPVHGELQFCQTGTVRCSLANVLVAGRVAAHETPIQQRWHGLNVRATRWIKAPRSGWR